MSVCIFTDTELAGLWHRLGGDEELQYALHALGIANRAAYMLTYASGHQDACTIEVPRFEKPQPTEAPCSDWSASTWAENLLYNCVSNGGTDFAPLNHRAKLLAHARKADARDGIVPDVTTETDAVSVPW